MSAFAGAKALKNLRPLKYHSPDACNIDARDYLKSFLVCSACWSVYSTGEIADPLWCYKKMEAHSTLLETLDARVTSNIKSKEKMAVRQAECESWRSCLSNNCRCSTQIVVFRTCR